VSKLAWRPAISAASFAIGPLVAWRMKRASAAAPRISAKRKAKNPPEERRPEMYCVVMRI
jgi:hypothetical protein